MSSYENNNGQLTLIDGMRSVAEVKEIALDSAGALIAPIEKTSTASQAYAIGKQFVYNGLLTEATSAIAQGDIITVGSGGNAKLADCVTDQLTSLKAALTDLEDVTNNNLGTANNLQANVEFTCPSDGYITITGNTANYYGFVTIKGATSGAIYLSATAVGNGHMSNSVFVRKGMKAISNFNFVGACYFTPLE